MTSDERLPWFPCEPGPLLGALAQMPPTQGYVYSIVLLRIYEANGPCPDTLDALARRTGYNKRIVSDALDKLFREERLFRVEGGIHNRKAKAVLDRQIARHKRHAEAGREGGIAKAEKTKQPQAPRPSPAKPSLPKGHTEKDLEVEVVRTLFPQEGNSAPETPDARTKLFREGVAILIRITGKLDRGVRSLIARLLRDANDDAVLVLRAIEDADRNRVAEPVSWIVATVKQRTGGSNGIHRQGDAGRLTPGMLAASYRARSTT